MYMHTTIRHIVAIPARDEAERIGPCLRALVGQAQRVLLLVNNTRDGTEHIATAEAAALGLDLTVSLQRFTTAQSSAGHARKTALDVAAAMDPSAVLLTTDADTRAAPDWISANLRHLSLGADAVAGRAILDPVDAATIPPRLHEDDARESNLAALLDEIASILDPDPADPWPRHAEHSGASICVTPAAFRRAGGIPDRSLGEDRGFFDALRRVDAVVRHALDVTVTVSGRIVGRARGGMADTIRRRLTAPDLFLDDAIEPVNAATRRARLRAQMRCAWRRQELPPGLSSCLDLSSTDLRHILAAPFFGEAWAQLEARCQTLQRTRVPAADVQAEIATANRVLASLRPSQDQRTSPSGMSQLADVQPA